MDLNIRGKKSKSTNSYRYLGIDIDKNLTFQDQFNSMSQKIAYKIWIYRHNRINMDDVTALIIFKTMLLPYFDYGCIFLPALPVKCYKKLQIYCNIALRICFKIQDPTDCAVKDL